MSNFLQDVIINKLNGYYLMLYARDMRLTAFCLSMLSNTLVCAMVVLGLIPPRIRCR